MVGMITTGFKPNSACAIVCSFPEIVVSKNDMYVVFFSGPFVRSRGSSVTFGTLRKHILLKMIKLKEFFKCPSPVQTFTQFWQLNGVLNKE